MSVHETSVGPIEVLRQGEGANAAVLLHAAASGPRALFKVAGALSVAGMTTACPALHGYGATRIKDAAPTNSFAAHVAVARWTLDDIAPEPSGRRILIGHSMGGTVALLTALGGMRLDALVLYEPIVLDMLDASDPTDAAARAWDAACIEKLHTHFANGDAEAGVAAFVEAYNEVAWTVLPEALRHDLVSKASNLVAETRAAQSLRLDRTALAAIACRVLILQGDRSPQVTQRMCAGLVKAIPHAERRTIEGAGHMGPVMSHAAVAREIGSFLAHPPLPPRAP